MNVVINDILLESNINNLIIMYYNSIVLDVDIYYFILILDKIYISISNLTCDDLYLLKKSILDINNEIYKLLLDIDKENIIFFIDFLIKYNTDLNIKNLLEFNDLLLYNDDLLFIKHCFLLIQRSISKLINNTNLLDTVKIFYDIDYSYISSIFYNHEISIFIIKNISYLNDYEIYNFIEYISKNYILDNDIIYWSSVLIYYIKISKCFIELRNFYNFIISFNFISKAVKIFLKLLIIENIIKWIIECKYIQKTNFQDNDFNIFNKNSKRLKYIYDCIKIFKNKNICLDGKKNFVKNYENSKLILKEDIELCQYYIYYYEFMINISDNINEQYIEYDY